MSSNAVYGSRDKYSHVNRRIFKKTVDGHVLEGGSLEANKTACSHADINYIPQYFGMTKDEIDPLIPWLVD